MCKCPPLPLPTGTITVYLLLNVLLLVVELTKALYMVGPADIRIQSITKCPNYEESDIILDYSIDEVDNSLTGNMTLNIDIDETIKINLREKPVLPHQPMTVFLNQRSLCKLADILYYYGRPDSDSICPILAGDYYIKGLKIHFALLQVPYEMYGSKSYQLEMIKEGNLLICFELQILTTKKNVSEYDQYVNVYKRDTHSLI